jgi:transcriptional regulator with XRE-family HTH domain
VKYIQKCRGDFVFFDNLKETCELRGISVTSATQQLGVSRSNVTSWKKGTAPNSDVVVRLSELLDISTDFLLTGKERIVEETPQTRCDRELLSLLRSLDDHDKAIFIGRIQEYLLNKSRDVEFAAEFAAKEKKAG